MDDPLAVEQATLIGGKGAQAGPEGGEPIGCPNRLVGQRRAQLAEESHISRLVAEEVLGLQGRGQRGFQPLRQSHQFLTGCDCAGAGKNDGAARARQHAEGSVKVGPL